MRRGRSPARRKKLIELAAQSIIFRVHPHDMNAIDQVFEGLRAKKRRAFMPFITAGDPDLNGTSALIKELARSGANLIEVGFPYSDPIADGPPFKLPTRGRFPSTSRSTPSSGTSANSMVPMQAAGGVPLVAMVSYALVMRRGLELFIADAQAAGFSGAIVPDLPLEESEQLATLAKARDFKLIFLVTPTTSLDRARRIAAASTGFLYYVSVTGITGERRELPPALKTQLAALRDATKIPICVGFGISTPEHVRALRDWADGIIVGSALVRPLEQVGKRPLEQIVAEIGQMARGFSDALVT